MQNSGRRRHRSATKCDCSRRSVPFFCLRKDLSQTSVTYQCHLSTPAKKQGLAVTSTRLPSGCPCHSMASVRGHRLLDWSFPHGSRKQQTHCLVSTASMLRSTLFRRSVVTDKPPFLKSTCELVVRQRAGAVLTRLLSTSNTSSTMYFITFSPFTALVALTFLTVNLPFFTLRCIGMYWTSMCLVFPTP